MKRYLFVIMLVSVSMVLSGICFAQQKNTGCGLGSMAFEGKTGLMQQVMAATTNGTLGTQTFGITSGTSNCEQAKSFVDNENINKFVAENMDSLAKDIARGSGEHLYALSVLMDIPQSGQTQWNAGLQKNFSRIYPSANVSHIEVIKNIEAVMASQS